MTTNAHHPIRHAHSGDADSIINVIHRVFTEYGFILDVPLEMPDLLDIDQHYGHESGAFFVYELDNKVIGTIGVHLETPQTAEIFRLYLLSDYRGKGVGHDLLKTAVQWATQKGVKEITLWTDTRFDLAHSLYSRFGFIQGAERVLTDLNESTEYQFMLSLQR